MSLPDHKAKEQVFEDKHLDELIKNQEVQYQHNLTRLIADLKPATAKTLKLIDHEYSKWVTYHYHGLILPTDLRELSLISINYHYTNSFLRTVNHRGKITYYQIESIKQVGLLLSIAVDSSHVTSDLSVSDIHDSKRDAPTWSYGIEASNAYTPEVQEQYAKIHEELSEQVFLFLQSHPEIKKVRFIELGCGHSLALLATAMKAAKILGNENIICVGSDFSPTNIQKSQQLWQSTEQASEIKSSFSILDSTLPECENMLQRKVPEFEDIVICCGHISRTVLNNIYEARQVLHNIARSNISTLFVTGRREELYSPKMIDQMGGNMEYKKLQTNHKGSDVEPVCLITFSNKYRPTEQAKKAYATGDSTHYLDLSFSPQPIEALRELTSHPVHTQIQCIDLSYCVLSGYDQNNIAQVLKFFIDLRKIVFCTESQKELSYIKNLTITNSDISIHAAFLPDERLASLPLDIYSMLNKESIESLKLPADIVAIREAYFPCSLATSLNELDYEKINKNVETAAARTTALISALKECKTNYTNIKASIFLKTFFSVPKYENEIKSRIDRIIASKITLEKHIKTIQQRKNDLQEIQRLYEIIMNEYTMIIEELNRQWIHSEKKAVNSDQQIKRFNNQSEATKNTSTRTIGVIIQLINQWPKIDDIKEHQPTIAQIRGLTYLPFDQDNKNYRILLTENTIKTLKKIAYPIFTENLITTTEEKKATTDTLENKKKSI